MNLTKEQLIQRLKWAEESTNDFIAELKLSVGYLENKIELKEDTSRILGDILIACDLNDDEPEKHWEVK